MVEKKIISKLDKKLIYSVDQALKQLATLHEVRELVITRAAWTEQYSMAWLGSLQRTIKGFTQVFMHKGSASFKICYDLLLGLAENVKATDHGEKAFFEA